jgi:hypothetical protein
MVDNIMEAVNSACHLAFLKTRMKEILVETYPLLKNVVATPQAYELEFTHEEAETTLNDKDIATLTVMRRSTTTTPPPELRMNEDRIDHHTHDKHEGEEEEDGEEEEEEEEEGEEEEGEEEEGEEEGEAAWTTLTLKILPQHATWLEELYIYDMDHPSPAPRPTINYVWVERNQIVDFEVLPNMEVRFMINVTGQIERVQLPLEPWQIRTLCKEFLHTPHVKNSYPRPIFKGWMQGWTLIYAILGGVSAYAIWSMC